MTQNEKELVRAIEQLLTLVNDLMPGVQHIALRDYTLLNEAPIVARKAIQRVHMS